MPSVNSPSSASKRAGIARPALRLAGLLPMVMMMSLQPHPGYAQSEATVIELTQIPCQFLESEAETDHGFKSARKADCAAINARTASGRLAAAQPLHLKPGNYIFRVTNKNVPYELGFWLRGAGLVGRTTLPSVSGGGLKAGHTRDYAIELTPGQYEYSCPLNPTPDYRLVVSD